MSQSIFESVTGPSALLPEQVQPSKPLDMRSEDRFKHVGRVRIGCLETGQFLSATLINLSMGGCRIALKTPLSTHVDATIEVSIQTSYLIFRSLGSVRAVDREGLELGIAFTTMPVRARRALTVMLNKLAALGHPRIRTDLE